MLPAEDTPTEVALDLLTVAGQAAIGFLIGAAVSILLSLLMLLVSRKNPRLTALRRHLRMPQRVLLTLLGTGTGIMVASAATPYETAPAWRGTFAHGFVIALILAGAYVITGVIKAIEDSVIARNLDAIETPRFRRIRTQMQVIAKVLIGIAWVGALAGTFLTFEAFRAVGASLLASAGLLSLVAGLAAQSSLTNMFAGIQIAFTDALRVGDLVVADDNQGTIEEITLTYVVLRSWDDRRWIVPSTLFTTKTFENWTRIEPKLQGTVEFDLDWLVPVEAVRIELQRIVQASELWDGRTCSLQVTDATGGYVRIRAVVSAATASDLWNLRCQVREELIGWLLSDAVYALPRTRLEPETTAAPPQEERVEFVEQVKADWEAQQTEGDHLEPPSDEPQSPGQEGLPDGGRLSWLKALRRL